MILGLKQKFGIEIDTEVAETRHKTLHSKIFTVKSFHGQKLKLSEILSEITG